MNDTERDRIMSKILVLEAILATNKQIMKIVKAEIALNDRKRQLLRDKLELEMQLKAMEAREKEAC